MIPPRSRRLARRLELVTGAERRTSWRLTRVAILRARRRPSSHESPLLDELAADGWWWGEVVGWNLGANDPYRSVVRAWMRSEAHREVVTSGFWTHVGAGVATLDGPDGRWDFVVVVGRRS